MFHKLTPQGFIQDFPFGGGGGGGEIAGGGEGEGGDKHL